MLLQELSNLVERHSQLLHITAIKHREGFLEEIEEKALDISFCILESIF